MSVSPTPEAPEREPLPEPEGLTLVAAPERDVRARSPAALGLILRLATLRQFARVASLLVLDFATVFAAIFVALLLKDALLGDPNVSGSLQRTQDTVAFAYLVAMLQFARSGLYAERGARPGLTKIVASLFQTMVVTLIFALVQGEHFQSYYIFYGTLFFGILFVGSARWSYERLTGIVLRAAGYRRRAVLIGTGEQIEAVAHALANAPDPEGVEVIGFISLTPRPDNGLKSLGTLEDLGAILLAHHLDEVIIADPAFPQPQAVELVDRCHRSGVRVRVAPSTMEILVHRAELVPGQSVPLFELKPPVFEGTDFVIKRFFDLATSALLLALASPVLLAIGVGIRLTSRGPVIYRSQRPGIGGHPFACLKFRTMYEDADQQQAELESLNEATGALFKMREDPRMTPFGRLLRKYSLDELPQLLNVLKGEMSLVGPRPLPQRDYDMLEDWHKKRYLVLPGITGLWQVSGRSDLDFDDLVRLDFLYLERWSPYLDFTILLKTVPAVFGRRGAF